jgi:hypothetical protein
VAEKDRDLGLSDRLSVNGWHNGGSLDTVFKKGFVLSMVSLIWTLFSEGVL